MNILKIELTQHFFFCIVFIGMNKIHRLVSVQHIPASLKETWDFFSDPKNLATITPPFLNLFITNEVFGEEVYPGQIMTYNVRPILGIKLEWMTEITHVEKQKMFVDEQRKGPYKLWHHQHHFKTANGNTEMMDLVHYRLPLSFLGEMMHPAVERKLLEIFTFRFKKIIELFGDTGAALNVKID